MNKQQQWGRFALAGLMAASLFLTACNSAGGGLTGPNPNAKVATVDGAVITRSEYDKTMKELSSAMHIDLNSVSDPAQKQMLQQTLSQMALQKLINDTLLSEDAKALGITITDADVKKFKDAKIESNPKAKEELKQYLSENHMNEKDFDDLLKHNLMAERFVEMKGGDKLQVTDKDAADFYNKNPEKFKLPEQIKASHILVKAIVPQMTRDLKAADPKKSSADIQKEVEQKRAELKTKADKLYEQVKADPKKFEELAKTNSDDPGSAKQGGDLSYVVQQNIDPVFWQALKETKPGQLHNGVVETQFGYHIIKVEDVKPPKNETLAEIKPKIKEFLEGQKKQALLQQWMTQKMQTAKIDIAPEFQPKKPEPVAQPGVGQPNESMPPAQQQLGQPAAPKAPEQPAKQ